MVVRNLSNRAGREHFPDPVKREHDIGIERGFGRIEVSRHEVDFLRIGVRGYQPKAKVVFREGFHSFDVCSRCADQPDAAVFQVSLEWRIRNATAGEFHFGKWGRSPNEKTKNGDIGLRPHFPKSSPRFSSAPQKALNSWAGHRSGECRYTG